MIRPDDRVLAARARRDRFELEPAQERPPAGGEAKEILIVASTFLGDMIMTLPLVAAVCRRHPQANVTLLVRKEYVALAEKVKGVRRVIPEPMGYMELRKIAALVPNRFDIAFVAFETRHLPLMAALDVREIVSFDDPKGRHSHLIDRMIPFPTDKPELTHQSWLSLRLLGSDPQLTTLSGSQQHPGTTENIQALCGDAYRGTFSSETMVA